MLQSIKYLIENEKNYLIPCRRQLTRAGHSQVLYHLIFVFSKETLSRVFKQI
jgi:hypothetical protein